MSKDIKERENSVCCYIIDNQVYLGKCRTIEGRYFGKRLRVDVAVA